MDVPPITSIYWSKVDVPNSVFDLKRTPIFECCMVETKYLTKSKNWDSIWTKLVIDY